MSYLDEGPLTAVAAEHISWRLPGARAYLLSRPRYCRDCRDYSSAVYVIAEMVPNDELPEDEWDWETSVYSTTQSLVGPVLCRIGGYVGGDSHSHALRLLGYELAE